MTIMAEMKWKPDFGRGVPEWGNSLFEAFTPHNVS